MRLATFNVLHGRSPVDDRVDVDRFAGAVQELDADVLALQEVDRDQPRSHRVDLTAVAAEAGGYLAYRFGPALAGAPGSWAAATGDEPAGTPLYGVALLARTRILSWDLVRLPALPVPVPVLFPGRRHPVVVRDEPRVALVGRLESGLTVASTHLSFIPWWNRVQLRLLARRIPQDAPFVLMGDLNVPPDVAVRTTRLRPLAAGLTYPADAPREQIDHLLARGVRAAAPGEVRRLPVSDHCALVAQVRP